MGTVSETLNPVSDVALNLHRDLHEWGGGEEHKGLLCPSLGRIFVYKNAFSVMM